jgi:hypothetical protein
MLQWTLTLVRAWTALYTVNMPRALADVRRAEILSDLWEYTHDPQRAGDLVAACHVLLRLIRGVPDDVLWRMELMDLRSRRRRTALWLTAATAALLVPLLWVNATRQDTNLPAFPRSPMQIDTWLMSAMPPPPPPPPPPPAGIVKRGGHMPPPPLAPPPLRSAPAR